MGFTVTFYNFEKRNNSTKRPGSDITQTSYNCRVLNGTGIINPKIELDIGLTENPQAFNYCYIPDFKRYYFVREWTYDRGLWIGSLAVDVLATYKNYIGASNLYVLRAAGAYDGNIVDNFYPVKTNCVYHTDTMNVPYTTGCYIIGVVSKLGAYGSIAYYVLDSANMPRFIQALMETVSVDNGFSLNDASMALQTSLVDPIQYIKSVMWCPFSMADLTYTPATQLDIFNWTLTNINCGMIYGKTLTKSYNIPLTKHPDTQSRGNYVNNKPYTNITLNFPPFGNIELDTTATANVSSLYMNLDYDIFTGAGQLRVICNSIIVNQITAQLGVPVQISQITQNFMGAAQSIVSGIGSVVSGALTGGAGLAAGITNGINAIGNAASAMIPRANSIGGNGNYTILNHKPELDYQFFRPVDDDIEHNGRPLCQKRVLSTLSGYMLIQDGDVITDGTSTEDDQIRTYLESGFYYE